MAVIQNLEQLLLKTGCMGGERETGDIKNEQCHSIVALAEKLHWNHCSQSADTSRILLSIYVAWQNGCMSGLK